MITRKLCLMLASALALCNIAHAHDSNENLLVNGDFEDAHGFVANSDDSMSLKPGDTAMRGWRIVNSSGLDAAWLGPKNPWIPASHGQYYVDLAGYHGTTPWSGVSQTFFTWPGHLYTVSFDLGHWGTSPSSLHASAATTSRDFTSSSDATRNWDTQTFTFWAYSDRTTLTLLGTSASNGNYLAIDNVVVKRAERW